MKTITNLIAGNSTRYFLKNNDLALLASHLLQGCFKLLNTIQYFKQYLTYIFKYWFNNRRQNKQHKLLLLLNFIFIFSFSSIYLSTTANAASIVETFEPLEEKFHHEFKSDIYEVWVKPIFRNQVLTELDGIPDETKPFDPVQKGFENSFAYKSINDIKSDDFDEHSKCYQYYYKHVSEPENAGEGSIESIDYRSESIPEDMDNSHSTHCIEDSSSNKPDLYKNAYDVMSHSNNWTTFDVGHDVDSYLGAVRVYIQLNSGHDMSNSEIMYDIRPKHTVADMTDSDNTLGFNNKYIKVRAFGGEYVIEKSKPRFKKVLVLDITQPIGTQWSGQFNVSFVNAKIIDDIKSPYPLVEHFKDDVNFQNEQLDKHPLFIFANPLPEWYYNLASKTDYDGCPKTHTDLGLPDRFYTPSSWVPGQVVETVTYLDKDGTLGEEVDLLGIRKIPDLILKSYSKNLCIPGGVYVKGRIIHHQEYHTNSSLKLKTGDPDTLSPGDPNDRNNAKGVKIVGRGILSGIHIKYRSDPELIKENGCTQCPCEFYDVGGGWNGHLIELRHKGNGLFPTGPVVDEQGKALDCYYRDEDMGQGNANCVQGITLVDSPKASIFADGQRMDVENVKIMSWHIKSNGIGAGEGSQIKNVFIKANDDSIVMGKSHMRVENATVWRQKWGAVVNLSWNLGNTISDSHLNGLNVIRFDQGQQYLNNGNASIISARNLMGGSIENFSFSNIVVEDQPYEIINLQLDDENAYAAHKRKYLQNLKDGIGGIRGIKINGLFTQQPYKVLPPPSNNNNTNMSVANLLPNASEAKIQKSVLSIYDELFNEQYVQQCVAQCENDCEEKCEKKCEDAINLIGTDPAAVNRSISGMNIMNMCINNDGNIKGLTSSQPVYPWETHVDDYFEYTAGVNWPNNNNNNFGKYPTGFNGIRGNGDENSAHICPELKTAANMCTIENLKNSIKSGLCKL